MMKIMSEKNKKIIKYFFFGVDNYTYTNQPKEANWF